MSTNPGRTQSEFGILPRCEACELEAARMAYRAGLGASEWEAFIHHVPECPGCRKVALLMGRTL